MTNPGSDGLRAQVDRGPLDDPSENAAWIGPARGSEFQRVHPALAGRLRHPRMPWPPQRRERQICLIPGARIVTDVANRGFPRLVSGKMNWDHGELLMFSMHGA
jgi:hypothetical protein